MEWPCVNIVYKNNMKVVSFHNCDLCLMCKYHVPLVLWNLFLMINRHSWEKSFILPTILSCFHYQYTIFTRVASFSSVSVCPCCLAMVRTTNLFLFIPCTPCNCKCRTPSIWPCLLISMHSETWSETWHRQKETERSIKGKKEWEKKIQGYRVGGKG